MTKCKLWIVLLSLGVSTAAFAQMVPVQVEFNNTTGECAPKVITPCTSSSNQASFYVTPPPADSVDASQPNILPRFKAFWITGDGNFLMFKDTDTDAGSRNPPPYNYALAGTYTVSTYLTGKYTNHHPPKGGQRSINVGAPPPTVPGAGANPNTPTPFNKRAESGLYDFFPIHDLRKDYLTPLILSYPASVSNSWCYLFYNGHGSNRRGAFDPGKKPLEYQKADGEVPRYYNGTASRILSYPTSALSAGGDAGIDGLPFSIAFQSMSSYYSDVVYFPLETVPSTNLPSGFDQKRYFPVFHAKPDITISPEDSLLSFCFIVTSDKPASAEQQSSLEAFFRKLDWPLNGVNSIIRDGTVERNKNFNSKDQAIFQDPTGGATPQYIQGVYISDVKYVAAHDPNALSILNIEPLANGKYKVTFHLEMCNKGGGRTTGQHIDLFDKFGRFGNFMYNGSAVTETSPNSHRYSMTSTLEIEGIPEDEYEMQCKSIEFTAVTDCEGIKSLWDSAPDRAFEVCVKFKEAPDVECGENYPIAACAFKVDGKCPCMGADKTSDTCGGDGWFLAFLLIFVFILLVWKYYNDQANNL